jgi:hypothetical protein
MGIFRFVFIKARHLTGVKWVLYKHMNTATTALQGNYYRSNRSGLRRHQKRNNATAGLGMYSTTTSHYKRKLWEVSIVIKEEVGILLLTDML